MRVAWSRLPPPCPKTKLPDSASFETATGTLSSWKSLGVCDPPIPLNKSSRHGDTDDQQGRACVRGSVGVCPACRGNRQNAPTHRDHDSIGRNQAAGGRLLLGARGYDRPV